ncbi:hypothetical protein LTR41_011252 [Exophiala xenobiotica]|nr:hypothetical protein LTR41_011252 [Exophiala xenobiotica]KAK5550919.1 hypothetical protein LTR46_011062 [Exophiala xenobiotica]
MDAKNAGQNELTPVETHARGGMQDLYLVPRRYEERLRHSRSLKTMLFMSLAIAAVPFGLGSPLITAIYGGGPRSMFIGLIVVILLNSCIGISLAELASHFPTSGGPYYWCYRLLKPSKSRQALSFLTGYVWLIGNWTITLSVNFGFASLLAATVSIYVTDWTATNYELLLIFYGICVVTFTICALGDRLLPVVDTIAATFTLITVIAVLLALSMTAKAGRHSASYALWYYDDSFSGWGAGFTFFIGLLPPAYTFSAIGMVASMAEECQEPEVQLPQAMSLTVPIGGIAALAFILPICFTLPNATDIIAAPYGQALPYIIHTVMGTQAGAIVIMVLVLLVTLFCSISITTTASRCTWAFSRDNAIPLSHLWSKTFKDRPLAALCLVTLIEMLLGLINLGSTSAFTAFISVGVIALASGYFIPICISFVSGRQEVSKARWTAGPLVGRVVNGIALLWIAFELVLFSMPTALPVTEISMNYASVVYVAFLILGAIWYIVHGRKNYHGQLDQVIVDGSTVM